jgi:transcriptional regulator with XRE-family HTH domain
MICLLMAAILFGDWLNAENDKRGWVQADLARKSGLKTSTVSRLVTGARNPGLDACIAIARAYDYPVEVVYRAAGLLELEPEKSEKRDLVQWLFDTAHPDDQEAAIAMLQVLRDQRAQREREQQEQAAAKRRRGRPAEG